jgi:hypothetical protein
VGVVILLWALLGTLTSVASHGLRDRIACSRAERDRLQDQVRELTVMEDRDLIAAEHPSSRSTARLTTRWSPVLARIETIPGGIRFAWRVPLPRQNPSDVPA